MKKIELKAWDIAAIERSLAYAADNGQIDLWSAYRLIQKIQEAKKIVVTVEKDSMCL